MLPEANEWSLKPPPNAEKAREAQDCEKLSQKSQDG
jgi:hypothetical protein